MQEVSKFLLGSSGKELFLDCFQARWIRATCNAQAGSGTIGTEQAFLPVLLTLIVFQGTLGHFCNTLGRHGGCYINTRGALGCTASIFILPLYFQRSLQDGLQISKVQARNKTQVSASFSGPRFFLPLGHADQVMKMMFGFEGD